MTTVVDNVTDTVFLWYPCNFLMDYPAHPVTLPLSFCLSLSRDPLVNSFFPHFRPLKAVTLIAKQKVRGLDYVVGGAHSTYSYPGYHHYMSLSKKLTTSKDQRDLETESTIKIQSYVSQLL